MLTSLLQTLADLLAGGTALTSTEQIDFSHPANRRDQGSGPLLNLYLYDIRESKQVQHSGRQVDRTLAESGRPTASVAWPPTWFDVSMMLTASDRTTLGEHHLLDEALSVLLRHRLLREDFLSPDLRGHGNLTMTVGINPPLEIGGLWSAVTVPLRPALFITVTVPFVPRQEAAPLVVERILGLQPTGQLPARNGNVVTRRVAIAGIVRSATTQQALADVEVGLVSTERSVTSDAEGVFFFENLRLGSYVLQLNCAGYQSQTCNVLVDSPTYAFKEIALAPA
jgi:hypothetical protein